MDALVTTHWLAQHLGDNGLLVLDASYTSTIPGAPAHDPLAAYRDGHVPGARYLDLDALVDPDAALPSTVPPRERFVARMEALGVGAARQVVLYDDGPHHTSCRAWWLLRLFGVAQVAILDGGLAKWRAEGRPLDAGDAAPVPAPFAPAAPRAVLRTLDDMRANLASGAAQVADARSPARFTGAEAETRPGVASGHIPGSRNLHYAQLFAPDGTFKRGAALAAAFAEAGIDLERPLVATCGSGITAAIIVFAAHLLGHDAALYDGSWSEWGADPTTPKAQGQA